jgi:N-acetylmuramoyl-L-alanine amidase
MAYTIVLDAGHGASDLGATYEGRNEKDDNLALTLAVGNILSRFEGIDVIYTRDKDIYDSPSKRAQIANGANADYFISIHRNSTPVPESYSGVETLVYNNSGKASEIARNIDAQLEAIGLQNLGITERKNLTVLKNTKMPAVLLEVGYINTEADNKFFDANFDQVAQAIADGILVTLGY